METPLFDKSCIFHASRRCGVDTIARAGWGRNGLSTWAGSVMRKVKTTQGIETYQQSDQKWGVVAENPSC